jgi:stage V sporulation protein SpoVS
MNKELTDKTKKNALNNGADLVGVVDVDSLDEHSEDIHKILPQAKSVIVVAAKHSLAAIQSNNIQMGQFDTIHAYNESAGAAHRTSRFLESEGFSAAAVPAFIPIDMQAPNRRASRIGFLRRKRAVGHKSVWIRHTSIRLGDNSGT